MWWPARQSQEIFKHGKTISEFLYIDNILEDGFGFEHSGPNWSLDAAPSRPIFYKV